MVKKFKNSPESISSALLLWGERATQTAIAAKYDIKVWPATNILNSGPLHFNIPPQPKGFLTEISVVTKVKLQKNKKDIETPERNVAIINNFANSLFTSVDVALDERSDITQSMTNVYPYLSFFNTVLNSESNRIDDLFYQQRFLMDGGSCKADEERCRDFWKFDYPYYNWTMKEKLMTHHKTDATRKAALDKLKEPLWTADKGKEEDIKKIETELNITDANKNDNTWFDIIHAIDHAWIPNVINPAAALRSRELVRGKTVTLVTPLHVPIFNTTKCLPNEMKIRITLNKNKDKFLLLTNEDEGEEKYSVYLEDCFLHIYYYQPHDAVIKAIDDRLKIDPASYIIDKPEIIHKPITNAGRIVRINDVFQKVPAYAFFCLQNNKDFDGAVKTNPFTFIPFEKFQFYSNGVPHFKDPLEVGNMMQENSKVLPHEFGDYLKQLHKTIGRDITGDCLINSSNFALNFIVGMSFGADRSNITQNHLNVQEEASTYLEIDMGINTNIPKDMLLIVYCLYNQQILIDGNRQVEIIE